MRNGFARPLIASFLTCLVTNAFGGGLKSEIVPAAGHVDITVPAGIFLKIRTFTQEGGADRGVVSVTIDSHTANVLTAALIDTDSANTIEPINNTIIAGPAVVVVTAASDADAFVTYKKDKDSD
ncbi:MAG: hypothetical protein ABI925_03740 [Verrucomicrobiota bacterium]